jgi:type I restriction enzyme S subunit
MDKLLAGVEVEWKTLGEVTEIGTGRSNRQDEDEKRAISFLCEIKKYFKFNCFSI